MNKRLQGSLIQRPNETPLITQPPRVEKFWHAEHFGEVTKEDAIGAAQNVASSDEAKATGEVAKGAGKEILNIVKEGIKILASSLSGIAIFTGILLILEKRVITGNMSIEKLFEMTRVVCIVTAAISFGGAIVTYLMTIGKKTSQTKEFAEAKTAAENTAADAEMEAAIAASMASDTVDEASSNVPDSVQEGVANASSTVEDSGITST